MNFPNLKIVSFNIFDLPYWFVKDRTARVRRIAEYLKRVDADILCLQESFDIGHRRLIHQIIGTDTYNATLGFDETRRVPLATLDRTGGLVIFSKFPIKESGFIPFSRFSLSIVEFFSWKGMIDAIVDTPKGPLRIINTHLHSQGLLFAGRFRLKQFAEAFNAINNHREVPAIFVGDLNQDALPKQQKFAELLVSHGFEHPFVAGKNHDELPTYRPENPLVNRLFNPSRNSRRLDYILVRGMNQFGFRTAAYLPKYLKPPLSDHDPILLELSV